MLIMGSVSTADVSVDALLRRGTAQQPGGVTIAASANGGRRAARSITAGRFGALGTAVEAS
jgi:hypothetical protein